MDSARYWLRQSGVGFLPHKTQTFLSTFIYGSYDESLYINYWSVFHGTMGVVFALGLWYYRVARTKWIWYGLIVHTLWEIWQMISGWSYPLKKTGDSNVVDTFVDTVFFLTGVQVVKLTSQMRL